MRINNFEQNNLKELEHFKYSCVIENNSRTNLALKGFFENKIMSKTFVIIPDEYLGKVLQYVILNNII